jgi:nanoRNase/pAp phosphatase (c-di-AMP/oligoRNAs hydrolase)
MPNNPAAGGQAMHKSFGNSVSTVEKLKKLRDVVGSGDTLDQFQRAIRDPTFVRQMAVVHLGAVEQPDTLVQVADFFLKMAEATWSIVSGIHDGTLIVIFRNAGELALKIFGAVGSAGGHKDSARAEVPLENIDCGINGQKNCREFVLKRFRSRAT